MLRFSSSYKNGYVQLGERRLFGRRVFTLGGSLLVAAVLLTSFFWQTAAQAEVTVESLELSLTAQIDGITNQDAPNTNYATAPLAVSDGERSFIYFDLSELPADADVQSAVLSLNTVEAVGNLPQALGVRAVTEEWEEDNLTHATAPALFMGAVITTELASTETAQWNLTALVNGWQNNPNANQGLAVLGLNGEYRFVFSSRETGVAPKLVINYEVPTDDTPRPDLGDAPDSTNHHGINNTAYAGVNGQFPTVFNSGIAGDAPGPLHENVTYEGLLGNGISAERDREADQGNNDQDGVNNILRNPAGNPVDTADNDRQDDGWRNRNVTFTDCVETTLAIRVRKAAGATKDVMYLNVWFDGNRDGDWADVGQCAATDETPAGQSHEWIVQDYLVDMTAVPAGGTIIIPVTTRRVMNSTPNGTHWMRFTLSDEPAPTNAAGLADGRGPAAGYSHGETEDVLQRPQAAGEPGTLVIEKTVTTVNDPSPFKEPVEYTINLRHEGGTEPVMAQLRDQLAPFSRIVGQPQVTEITPNVSPLRTRVRTVPVNTDSEAPTVYQQVLGWQGALAPGAELEIKFRVVHLVVCGDEQTSKTISNEVQVQPKDGEILTASTSFTAACPDYSLDDVVVTQEIVENPTAAQMAYDGQELDVIGRFLTTKRFVLRTMVTNNGLTDLTMGFENTLDPTGTSAKCCRCLTCVLDINMPMVETVPQFDVEEHEPDHYTSIRRVRIPAGQSIMFETVLRVPDEVDSWFTPITLGWSGCLTCTFDSFAREAHSADFNLLTESTVPNITVTVDTTYCILDGEQNGCPDPVEAPDRVVEMEPLEVELCRCDLGDAPASMNHAATDMLAYPTVKANFPTVFDPAVSTPNGPRHNYPNALHLGLRVSHETEADIGPDQDPRNNINPVTGVPNRDRADDGIRPNQLNFTDCQRSTFNASVFINPQAKARILEADQNAVVYLNVWVDGNRDGDWADSAACAPVEGLPDTAVEHIVIDQAIPVASLNAGINVIPVATGRVPWPADMANMPSWLRVTLSELPANKPLVTDGIEHGDGRGYDDRAFVIGETEDYLLRPSGSASAGADMALIARATARVVSPRDAATGLPTGRIAVVYRLDYQNDGTETAQNVQLEALLPNGLVEADVEWTYLKIPDIQGEIVTNDDELTLDIGSVPAGASGSVIIKAITSDVWTDMRPLSATVNSSNDVDDSNDNDQANVDFSALEGMIKIDPNINLAANPVIRGQAFPGAMVEVEIRASGVETITAALPADATTGFWRVEVPDEVVLSLGGDDQFAIIATAVVDGFDNTPLFFTDSVVVNNESEEGGQLVSLHFAAGDQTDSIFDYPSVRRDEGAGNHLIGWEAAIPQADEHTIGAIIRCEDPNTTVTLNVGDAEITLKNSVVPEINCLELPYLFFEVVTSNLGNFEIQDLMSASLIVVSGDVERTYEGYVRDIISDGVSAIGNGNPIDGATVTPLYGLDPFSGVIGAEPDSLGRAVNNDTETAGLQGFFPVAGQRVWSGGFPDDGR